MPVAVIPDKILNIINLDTIRPNPVDISILDEKGAGETLNSLINPKSSKVFGSLD